MTQNPYETPKAALTDQPEAAKPREIRIALAMMWFSLIGGSLYGLFAAPPEDMDAESAAGMWILAIAVTLITVAIFAIPLVFIALRKNWARWIWLVLVILGWASTILFWESIFANDLDIVFNTLFGFLDIVSASLVFFGAGGRWFKE